jgi:hypothetical protein
LDLDSLEKDYIEDDTLDVDPRPHSSFLCLVSAPLHRGSEHVRDSDHVRIADLDVVRHDKDRIGLGGHVQEREDRQSELVAGPQRRSAAVLHGHLQEVSTKRSRHAYNLILSPGKSCDPNR